MSRRAVLSAVELALAASALSAAVYGLVRAAYDPYAAVQWVPIAIVGTVTALAFVGLAALLFVGRTALLLAPDAAEAVRVRRQRRAAPPSSRPPMSDERRNRAAEHRSRGAAEQQHAAAMAAVAAEPMQPQTIGYTAVMPIVQTGPTFGFGPYRVVDAPPVVWTAPVSDNAGRHAARAA